MTIVGETCGSRPDEKGRSVTRKLQMGLIAATVVLCGCLGGAASEDRALLEQVGEEFARAEGSADARAAADHLRQVLGKLPDVPKRACPHKEGLYGPFRRTVEEYLRTPSRAEQRSLFRKGRRQLNSLEAALTRLQPDSGIHARSAGKLREILARREFQHDDLRERIMAWAAKQVLRLMNWLAEHLNLDLDTSAGVVKALAVVLAFAALVLAGCLVASGLSALWRLWAAQREETPPSASSVEFSPRRTRQRLLHEARQYAASGDSRQAMRCLYHAIILTLHLAGLIDYDANRTNREYLATLGVSGSSILSEAFGAATSLFERSWYGCQRSGEAHVTRMAEFMRVVEASAPPGQGS